MTKKSVTILLIALLIPSVAAAQVTFTEDWSHADFADLSINDGDNGWNVTKLVPSDATVGSGNAGWGAWDGAAYSEMYPVGGSPVSIEQTFSPPTSGNLSFDYVIDDGDARLDLRGPEGRAVHLYFSFAAGQLMTIYTDAPGAPNGGDIATAADGLWAGGAGGAFYHASISLDFDVATQQAVFSMTADVGVASVGPITLDFETAVTGLDSFNFRTISATLLTDNINLTETPHAISGTVTAGGPGLLGVRLVAEPGSYVGVTAGDGTYSVGVPDGWSGTVTPELIGYGFTPVNRPYSNVTADDPNEDYTAAIVQVEIAGNISWRGDPVVGVVMAGLPGAPVVTDVNGDYSTIVDAGWTGTVTPTQVGPVFDPVFRDYEDVDHNFSTDNYTYLGYSISGTVGVEGVAMTGLPYSTTSTAGGSYSVDVLSGWSGTVTPVLFGYSFAPTQKIYSNVQADDPAEDYTPTVLSIYTISGKVTTGGNPFEGVRMVGLGTGTVTDPNGYSVDVEEGWSGTVTPTKTGYDFAPSDRVYSNVQADDPNDDYVGTVASKWSYTEDFSDPAWQDGGDYPGGGKLMVPPNPTVLWDHSVGSTFGVGVVYPDGSSQLECEKGEYEQQAQLWFNDLPSGADTGSVTFSWWDGYGNDPSESSSMNFYLQEPDLNATRFWITVNAEGYVQFELDNAAEGYPLLIQYGDEMEARSGNPLYTTVFYDNVAKTVSISSYNIGGNTSPVRTAPFLNNSVIVTRAGWTITGHSSGGEVEGSSFNFGPDITFAYTGGCGSLLGPTIWRSDITEDCYVDESDAGVLSSQWLNSAAGPGCEDVYRADINQDCGVDMLDFSDLASDYFKCNDPWDAACE